MTNNNTNNNINNNNNDYLQLWLAFGNETLWNSHMTLPFWDHTQKAWLISNILKNNSPCWRRRRCIHKRTSSARRAGGHHAPQNGEASHRSCPCCPDDIRHRADELPTPRSFVSRRNAVDCSRADRSTSQQCVHLMVTQWVDLYSASTASMDVQVLGRPFLFSGLVLYGWILLSGQKL